MGYTGHIIVNGKNILQEWKSSNTYFGQYYATAYLKHKWCELELSSLYEVISALYTKNTTEFENAEYQILYASQFIQKFKDIIHNKFLWKDDGTFNGKSYSEEEDRVGLYTYRYDGELSNHSHFFAGSYEFKRAFGDDNFGDDTLGQKYFDEMKNWDEFTRYHLMEFIDILSDITSKNMAVWERDRDRNKSFIQLLKKCVEMVQNGDIVKVRFLPSKNNVLQIASKNLGTIEDFVVEDEYPFYDLFGKNHLHCLGASCVLTTKKELGHLIFAFSKAKKRNLSVENQLKKLYSSIEDSDTISIDIDGCF